MLFGPGDDIAYNNNASITYGRIVTISGESMYMRIYSTDDDDDDDLEDILLLNYRKVVSTQQNQTINTRQFIDFIFVIPSSSLTSHIYNLEGVSNVFYITDAISPPTNFRFSSLLLQSILVIQKVIYAMLNKSTQFQVCRGSNKLHFNSYVWDYMCTKLGVCTSRIGSRTEKIFLSSLTKISKKAKVEIQSLTIASPEAFDKLKAMFGRYNCVGSRVKFPKSIVGQQPLLNGDTLNVLDNVKFIFVKKYSELTIKCTYHRVVFNENNVII
jgi:hypothetical protein